MSRKEKSEKNYNIHLEIVPMKEEKKSFVGQWLACLKQGINKLLWESAFMIVLIFLSPGIEH